MANLDFEPLMKSAEAAGQGHLFTLMDSLDPATRHSFFMELSALDWELLGQLKEQMKAAGDHSSLPLSPAPSIKKGGDGDVAAQARGEELLSGGKVAVFIVAGGQGSRLGFEGPKGMYPASPVRKQTLFQLFGAKIAALTTRFGKTVPWYVMTSQSNHDGTYEYFAEQDWFGLGEDQVKMFSQDMLPAMDSDGRLLLEAPGKLFLSPNGHGGSLLALKSSGALDDMKNRGIEQIFYFQVDNPLAAMADPIFLGHHDLAGAQMSTKVVSKRDAAEKVGVVGLIDGKYGVIEYSDLSDGELNATNDDGQLKFREGNIAVHMLRRDFVEGLTAEGFDLPYHVAKKNIPDVNPETGEARTTAGVKFETFVFDALGQCEKSVVLEVDRRSEFAPIKNAEGEDSPQTSRDAQTEMYARWLEAAGKKVERDKNGNSKIAIDIDPRFADSAAALAARDLSKLDLSGDLVLE
ncbi:MAG: UDP-N-acetylglucosamine/UDP-N-acetylgalactosamine diphosphorylase [Planctomycetota bacterium]|jgi:UDP-N-acetylglucosamine/UDP-N-acetylgalactosamine diphosphorylase